MGRAEMAAHPSDEAVWEIFLMREALTVERHSHEVGVTGVEPVLGVYGFVGGVREKQGVGPENTKAASRAALAHRQGRPTSRDVRDQDLRIDISVRGRHSSDSHSTYAREEIKI
jgi:hypothetical protein